MRASILRYTALAALLVSAMACSDDTSEPANDVGNPDFGDDATTDADAAGDTAVDADVDEPLPERTCGRPPAQDETARYDALSPIGEFVAEADIVLAGGEVTVNLVDFEGDQFPNTFGGTFAADSHCVDAELAVAGFDEPFAVDICFFNPDGSPATPGSLGAQIFVFFDGDFTGEPDVTLVGGVRRNLDLSCSLAGFFLLDTTGLSPTGDLPAEVAPAVETALLRYLELFEMGGGDVAGAMGEQPGVDTNVDPDLETGAILVRISTSLTVDVDGTDEEYTVDIEVDGTVNLATGALSGVLTVEISGDDDVAGTLSGTVTGTRG